MTRALVALLAALAIVLGAGSAWAFDPPPHTGLVTDTAGALREAERLAINQRLDGYRLGSGNTVSVLLVKALDGASIDDVAYDTFRVWGIGKKGGDTGVLLVIALAEHKIRIETGKGQGGSLTDLQANDIIRQKIAPRMRDGRVRDAVVEGTEAIMTALGGASAPGMPATTPRRGAPAHGATPVTCTGVVGMVLVALFVVVVLIFMVRRGGFFFFLPFGGGGSGGFGGSGGGNRRDDDGGYGGGESGGGGSSDDY